LVGTIAHELMHAIMAIWRLEGKMDVIPEKVDERLASIFEALTTLDEIGFIMWINLTEDRARW